MVLLATPMALTFSVMAFHVSFLLLFVTLSVNLLCKMPLFGSTFSVISVNSLVLFLFLPLCIFGCFITKFTDFFPMICSCVM